MPGRLVLSDGWIMKQLDRDRLGRVLAMASSSHSGEAENAIRLAVHMVAAAGVSWRALLAERQEQLQAQLATATEAASVLLAENNALRAELEQIRAAPSGTWLDVRDTTPSGTRKAALWLLQLHDEGRIKLNSRFERDFIKSCSTWRGPLTPKMAPIFERILQMIVERTGLMPPT